MSHVTALDRDARQLRTASRSIGLRELLLPMASIVALLTISLAYAGKMYTSALRAPIEGAPVNLNAVVDPPALEGALARAFPNAAERRAAAESLLQLVRARRENGRELPNVATLLEATRPVQGGAGRPVMVLSASALAAVKPSFVVRTQDTFWRITAACALLYVAAFWGVAIVWRSRQAAGDSALLAAAHVLTAIGFALLVSRADPLRDNLLFVRYTIGVVVGLAAMTAASLIDFRRASFLRLSYVPLALALLLSLLLVLFGDGPGSSRAKVNLGPVQPIEAIRLLLAFFLAGYFAQRWELLRQIRAERWGAHRLPAWLHLPRPEYVVPIVVGVGAALLLFFVQRDLGPALFLACVFLAMYAVARARVGMALAGSALLIAGFYAGYLLDVSDTLTARVAMWQSPWDNAVRGGDQVAQAVWAVSTGGWFGTGLGFGDTRYLPAGHTDLVLSAAGEELGLIGLVAVASLSVLIAVRGLRIALRAATDYGFFLALAVTLFLALPVLMMAAGVFGLTPLTGVVTPFLSYGGSAMVANLTALGVLVAINAHCTGTADIAPFRRPTACLGATLAFAAIVPIAVMCRVAVIDADELAVRPHLSLQADGVRRYQYNPRVLDVARSIPRGTIYDRNGLALATGNADLVRAARTAYAKQHIAIDSTCEQSPARCYPLGGAAFHLLGDETSRLNWAAPNSSYVERDLDSRLRGFDDHAVAVPLADAEGETHTAIRRDYRELLPLLRHRFDHRHAEVRTVLARPRDIRLTVDARLQRNVATILEKHAATSGTGHAAAIVIDTATGDALAVASYPFPSSGRATDDEAAATLLDRARYGLYPPGSTFKLVTAAAALDRGLDQKDTAFACSYLPDGRVGARIPGWSRPVRDDVLDRRPHGTLALHDGLVHSCNAYFAQLAVRVGAKGMMDTAAKLGITAAPGSSVRRLRDMLPQAGYGQGDVVATPLRMARVAAALAGGGLLHDVSVVPRTGDASPPVRFLSPDAARVLARDMRDAVLAGTGRSLKDHPQRIAGKTGTAEVAGAPSHSWFVGFAPFDGTSSRIAFAVIVENAGYGGTAAARVAGEIVTAAADAGLIR